MADDGRGDRLADAPRRPPLGYLLREAAAAHRLQVERALADLEVTPPQFLLLRLTARHPGGSSADLARMTALTTPTVSVIVSNLKRRGALVGRRHATHGRIQRLDVTEAGRALLDACEARVAAVETRLKAGTDPAELEVVGRWLARKAGRSG